MRKEQFLAQYGSRDQAMKMINNPEVHHWRIICALKNPNVTQSDLAHLSRHKDEIVRDLARDEHENRYKAPIK